MSITIDVLEYPSNPFIFPLKEASDGLYCPECLREDEKSVYWLIKSKFFICIKNGQITDTGQLQHYHGRVVKRVPNADLIIKVRED